jgi:thioredoxin 1
MLATFPRMASKNVLTIDDESFDAEVKVSELPMLIEFGAAWCGPCKALMPIIERIADDNAGRVRVAAVDIDESPGLAQRFGIRGAPTTLVLRSGVEVARQLGVTNRGRLLAMLGLDGAVDGARA